MWIVYEKLPNKYTTHENAEVMNSVWYSTLIGPNGSREAVKKSLH